MAANFQMKEKERINLIREGNKIFNEGNLELAQKYYLKADYKDGLLRIADHYFYEEKKPLNALPFYMKCGAKEKVDEIYRRIAFALGKLIQQDRTPETEEPVKPQNDPQTKIAEEIQSQIDQAQTNPKKPVEIDLTEFEDKK